jgi:acyl-CoA synthetase (AMP-forming)/AMP-acid ligase II
MCVERIDPSECSDLDLSSWEVAFNGAEPIRAETMSAFAAKFRPFGFRPTAFFPVYGLAEATLMVTAPKKAEEPATMRFDAAALLENLALPSSDPKDPLLVGCGKPDSQHCLKIVDPETEEVCQPGLIGEIWVAGPSVAGGYWSTGTDSGRTFGAALADEGEFLRTGDLGVIFEEELYVLGRLSDLIIVKGRNHHPHDIESLAEAASPLLIPHTSAAFELQSNGGEPLIALVTESKSTDEDELRNALSKINAKVAEDLDLPLGLTAVCRKGSVPKTTSGKIQRRLCRTLLLEGELEIVAEWRSPVARALPTP